MNLSRACLLTSILISISIFVISLFFLPNMIDMLLPKADHVSYFVSSPGEPFRHQLLLSAALSLAPYVIILSWKLAAILAFKKRAIAAVIVTGCMIVAIIICREILKAGATDENKYEGYHYTLQLNNIHFEIYAVIGLLIGGLLSYVMLRQRHNK